MENIHLTFAGLAVVFGVLGFAKIVSYDIALPGMYISLGIASLCDGFVKLKQGKKGSALLDFLLFAIIFTNQAIPVFKALL